jgi:hypothetical protein
LTESLALMTESSLAIGDVAALSAPGLLWRPRLLCVPLVAAAGAIVVLGCVIAARRAVAGLGEARFRRIGQTTVGSLPFGLQLFARLGGRIRHGLSLGLCGSTRVLAFRRIRTTAIWSEYWKSVEHRLLTIESRLRATGAVVVRGGSYDRWDLQITRGMLGGASIRAAVEQHGGAKQVLLMRSGLRLSRMAPPLAVIRVASARIAAVGGTGIVAAVLATFAGATVAAGVYECALTLPFSLRLLEHQAELGGRVR